jgi:tetratricopeptide (TPR) repeat protein
MINLWLSALVAEAAALVWVARGGDAWLALAGYAPLHALACALVSLAALRLFPSAYRRPRRWVLALLFGVSFFVPLLGIGAMLIGVAAGRLFPQLLKPRVFESVSAPEYTVTGEEGLQRPRGAAARARVLNRAAPEQVRLEALVAIGSSGSVAAGALLRDLLADPVDDVRLLAYGLLDKREKDVSSRLARERTLLEIAESLDDRDTARAVCGRIAHLYWELVYQGLAQGDTARFSLEQALIFAERSLREDSSDGPTWLMIARVRLRRGDWRAAEGALNEALNWKVPRRAVLPYLAELRFRQRRYADVRSAMFELGGRRGDDSQSASEVLAAMQEYWAA